jgi:hypothetical protein
MFSTSLSGKPPKLARTNMACQFLTVGQSKNKCLKVSSGTGITLFLIEQKVQALVGLTAK